MKEIQILDDIIIGSVNQPGNYKREDILKEIYPKLENETEGQYTMRCRKSAGKLNKLLEEADLITIKEHKQFSKDNKAKIVKKVVANDKNPWLFDSIVGQFGKESQPTFHLTAYGKEAVVVKEIRPYTTGEVKLDGKVWRAMSESKQVYKVDEIVTVLRIEGVTIIIK